jgi:adenylate cyclase 2
MASTMILLTMIFAEFATGIYVFSSTHDEPSYIKRIRPTFFLIMSSHVLLPFPNRTYSCVGSLMIIIIEMSFTIRNRLTSSCSVGLTYRYAVADFVFYLIAVIVSFSMTHLLEIANRRAFLDHRKCVVSQQKFQLEKEKEEQLLNSCLPKHLNQRVQKDIKTVITSFGIEARRITNPRPFNELYVEKFENVSILYADIVNSMLLAAKLSPSDLVETLNDLFGRFDDTAERNNCLRIKLLGDCYYCVSGVPVFDPNHAINCVLMGLEMIDIIRGVREERFVDVNMRIGIHSGMVLSGLIGLKKWQYDIWSIDAMIASRMEHEGVPGKVHVTAKTLSCIPENALDNFVVTPRETLGDTDEETFLIERKLFLNNPGNCSPSSRRRNHSERLKKCIGGFRKNSSFESLYNLRSQLIEDFGRYKNMVKQVNSQLADDIDHLPLSKNTQWFRPQGIHPIGLWFTRSVLGGKESWKRLFSFECMYATQDDSLFRYYLYIALCTNLAIVLIKCIIPLMIHVNTLKMSLIGSFVFIAISIGASYVFKIKSQYFARLLMWIVISSTLLLCTTIDLRRNEKYLTKANWTQFSELSSCGFPWYYTFSFILAMVSISLFLRVNIWFKALSYIVCVIAYFVRNGNALSVLGLWDTSYASKWTLLGYDAHIDHLWYVCCVGFLLHVIDRQIEYILRLDFQWTMKLERDKDEDALIGSVNKMLLENILPMHVADRFLHVKTGDELYSESYDEIAVLFASIPNYTDFYNESNINEQGMKCLLLLNEILCDFDKVLSSKNFSRVEKIKTIGSTYMAATGLRPGRASVDSSSSYEEATFNAVTMVRFAMALNETMETINKDALQDFKLRIGIAIGPVIAGVVGSVKPQYDIWGDTVNVASRMESTGQLGKIHVTGEMADLLKSVPLMRVECRGEIPVKGKGNLVTYFIHEADDVEDQSTC